MNRQFDSNIYWENRYSNGYTSGKGSYGELAIYKAKIINNFIKKNNIKNLIDYGVGDGNQLSLLQCENITGLDVSPTVINKLKQKYSKDNSKQFYECDKFNLREKYELILSCDVLYHLINFDIWEKYLLNLFTFSKKYVIIYSSDENIDYGNHHRSRKFTEYVKQQFPNWKLTNKIINKFNDARSIEYSLSNYYFYEKK
jgi:ubiquinone/menaquinone biosynthesis C-methylase UbiE